MQIFPFLQPNASLRCQNKHTYIFMAESKEELKSLLMKMKKESEKLA